MSEKEGQMDEGRNGAEEQERVEHSEMGRGKGAVETPMIKGKGGKESVVSVASLGRVTSVVSLIE